MKSGPILGTILAATLVSGAAFAESGRGEARFAEHDTDGNGVIAQSEVEAEIEAHFAEADSNGNGTLSEDETIAFLEARRVERHGSRREGRFGEHAGDDGVIDFEEFSEVGMRHFEMTDLDENGEVTETEMRLVAELHHGRGPRGRHDQRHDD